MFPGTDAHLRDSLGRDVILSNPFTKVAYPVFMEDTMCEIDLLYCCTWGCYESL